VPECLNSQKCIKLPMVKNIFGTNIYELVRLGAFRFFLLPKPYITLA